MSVINKIKEHWFKVKKESETRHAFESDQEKQYYTGLLAQLPVGEEYWIAIKEKRPTRTLAQNNYYWLYLDGISRETGYTSDELHEYYKHKFLKGQTKEIMGMFIESYPTTTQLTIKEFMEYIKNIEADCGIQSPDVRLCGLVEHLSRENML